MQGTLHPGLYRFGPANMSKPCCWLREIIDYGGWVSPSNSLASPVQAVCHRLGLTLQDAFCVSKHAKLRQPPLMMPIDSSALPRSRGKNSCFRTKTPVASHRLLGGWVKKRRRYRFK
jgi:hypothetical protein